VEESLKLQGNIAIVRSPSELKNRTEIPDPASLATNLAADSTKDSTSGDIPEDIQASKILRFDEV
jgi:hypothetical protein